MDVRAGRQRNNHLDSRGVALRVFDGSDTKFAERLKLLPSRSGLGASAQTARGSEATMSSTHLRRYTDLTALIFLLSEKKITLLDPASWDDKNDSHYLSLYKEKNKLKSVLALCFSETAETYHHWRVFANGSSGVCIKFKRANLLKALKKQPGLRMNGVKYLTLDEIKGTTLSVKDLPFLKRYAFEHECEFRVVYESDATKARKLDVPIPLSCIDKITLSPWMYPDFASHIKRVLHGIDGCKSLDVVRSTLIGNERWKSLGEDAV